MSSTSIRTRARLPAGVALALALPWTLAATAQQPPSQPAAAKPGPLLPLTSDEVLAHVRRTVTWYGDLTAVEQVSLPGTEPLARSQLQQQALGAVRLAFQFGKAAEDIIGREAEAQKAPAPKGGATAPAQSAAPTAAEKLQRTAADLSAREAALKSEVNAIDARLRRTRGTHARATLAAQRAGIAAALQLVQQIESNIEQLRRFQESAIAGEGKPPKGLRAQLAALETSVPELATGAAPATGATAAAAAAAHTAASASTSHAAPRTSKTAVVNFQPQSAGIVTLIGRWLTLHDYQVQVHGAIEGTTALEKQLTDTRSQVLETVRRLVGGGMASIRAGNTTQLAAQRPAIEAATGQLRELSGVIIPLAEQALALSGVQSTLGDWSHALAARESSVASYLGIRVGILLAWVAAVLLIGEIWRRATFRYLADARRRRPFLMLRRVLIGFALILVIVFNLVSQIGSIATYAGFVTAGVAVALQNVILAVVAYFFLIGRYGVRVGDRVTISGVTGRVVNVSLLRIYLLELTGPDLHSTGRMVVLSNAVLFQPTALFKQIPGAEYLWHGVTLTIVATADVEEASNRLQSAANKVYDTYRAGIERQHALAQRFIEFETAAPAPEVRVRLTDNGLECAVRYPVMPEKSARVDQEMLDALRKAVERDDQLKLVASGGVALKSSES
ncbi:MAG: mechanosensitive ion channel family protein [Steroidobacteraceae bacterium]